MSDENGQGIQKDAKGHLPEETEKQDQEEQERRPKEY